MGGFFRSKKFRIILCIIALLIGMMLYAVTQDGYTLPTTGFLGRILNPIRSASNSISTSVQDTLDVFTKSKSYQTENEELRQRVAELESQMVDYDKTKQDLADLSEFMGIKADPPDNQFSTPAPLSAMWKTIRSTDFTSTAAVTTGFPSMIRWSRQKGLWALFPRSLTPMPQ